VVLLNKKIVLLLLIVFSFGWLSNAVYSSYFNNHETDKESGINKINNGNLEQTQNKSAENKKSIDAEKEFEGLEKLFADETVEKDKASPYDRINQEQILVYNDEVVIKIQNPEWSIFTNTKSMDPVIDSTSNAIEIIPKNENDIHVGDIVAYESKYKEGIITHRVVEIGYDALGWYARLKGDNNDYIDPGKVRFNQIKRIIVAIIY